MTKFAEDNLEVLTDASGYVFLKTKERGASVPVDEVPDVLLGVLTGVLTELKDTTTLTTFLSNMHESLKMHVDNRDAEKERKKEEAALEKEAWELYKAHWGINSSWPDRFTQESERKAEWIRTAQKAREMREKETASV